jgi:hypothetical protein
MKFRMKADYEYTHTHKYIYIYIYIYIWMNDCFFTSTVTFTETIRNVDRFEEKAVGTL